MLQVDAVPAGARCSLLRCSHGLPSIHIESGRLTRRASNTSFVSTTMPHCAFLGGRTHKLVTADTVAAGTNTSGILAGTCERRACCTRRGTLPFDNTSVATGGFRAILTPLPTGRNAVTSLAVAATFICTILESASTSIARRLVRASFCLGAMRERDDGDEQNRAAAKAASNHGGHKLLAVQMNFAPPKIPNLISARLTWVDA